ncbi:hypothetical protein BDQ17DRAFT_1103001 [Cyathus striatus]|nr:hypothetical protein BDQ17DRAFT_1103001 [Cyathus striatus]
MPAEDALESWAIWFSKVCIGISYLSTAPSFPALQLFPFSLSALIPLLFLFCLPSYVLTPPLAKAANLDPSIAPGRDCLPLQSPSLSSPCSPFSYSSPTSMTAGDKHDHVTPPPTSSYQPPPKPNVLSTHSSRQLLSIRYLCNIQLAPS